MVASVVRRVLIHVRSLHWWSQFHVRQTVYYPATCSTGSQLPRLNEFSLKPVFSVRLESTRADISLARTNDRIRCIVHRCRFRCCLPSASCSTGAILHDSLKFSPKHIPSVRLETTLEQTSSAHQRPHSLCSSLSFLLLTCRLPRGVGLPKDTWTTTRWRPYRPAPSTA